MESNNKNSLGYKVGQALAFVIGVCIAAINQGGNIKRWLDAYGLYFNS